jgi:glycosyltransferase involved in cell wall biosynthesis
MKIALVNHTDFGGGAEKIALALLNAYLGFGWEAWLFVGEKRTDHPKVISLQREANLCQKLRSKFGSEGLEKERYVGLSEAFSELNFHPSLLHLHNIHGGYFDLKQIIDLSREFQILQTCHDFWPITGHCAFPMRCEGYLEHCKSCPDPIRYPAESKEKIPGLYALKKTIYQQSNIHSVVVSSYQAELFSKANLTQEKMSILPNGINKDVFYPGSRSESRKALGLDPNQTYVLISGKFSEANRYRDYKAVLLVLDYFEAMHPSVKFVLTGYQGIGSFQEKFNVVYLGEIKEESKMASIYRASNVLFHPSLADSQGLTVLEAIACGTPVLCYSLPSYQTNLNSANSKFAEEFSDFPELLESMLENPLEVPAPSSVLDWKTTTQQYKQLIERLLC